ncbi:MAG: sigma-70 family RNA polymerase sigma factor [Anaerolineae bacterium]|nr:sigma-70 family RNA polymerase sigma factor [Anaerolineae bacterium]
MPVYADADPALIAAARRGDLNAYNVLVLQFQDAVYSLAYRLIGDRDTAADAAQEALITAWRRLDSYRGGSFRAWLLRITANHCYDEFRRRKRAPSVSLEAVTGDDDSFLPIAAHDETPEQAVQRAELQRAIQNCLMALPADQRAVAVLSDVEGFDYQAIAEQVGAALGTVKSRLSRARAALRDCLRDVLELSGPSERPTGRD